MRVFQQKTAIQICGWNFQFENINCFVQCNAGYHQNSRFKAGRQEGGRKDKLSSTLRKKGQLHHFNFDCQCKTSHQKMSMDNKG